MLLSTIVWIVLASLISFITAAVFAGWLKLRRNIYLIAYIPISGVLICVFYYLTGVDLIAQFTAQWEWGLLGAAITSVISIRHVLIQESSSRRAGAGLVIDLLWPGFSYGFIDAMLLSVLPVTAIYHGLSGLAWTSGIIGQSGLWLLALLASLIVALCYHLGYPEYRGKQVLMTVVGNGIMTVAFLITGNPLAAVLPHCAMHIAAMWHGRETTYQLPPHYADMSPVVQ